MLGTKENLVGCEIQIAGCTVLLIVEVLRHGLSEKQIHGLL